MQMTEDAAGKRSSDMRVITLVAAAHYTSHVMQMALPPLLPILHNALGVSYTRLGLVVTCFYVASGLGQTVAGVLVDRYGAYRLLLLGLTLVSAGILLAGLAPGYWFLLPPALLAGLGNSVFHPADLSILSHRVSERWRGRSYAMHGLAGQLGFATSPLVVTAIAALADWRLALVVVGAAGLANTAFLFTRRASLAYDRDAAEPRPEAAAAGGAGFFATIASPVILMAFAYFMLTSFAGNGLQSTSIAAFTSGYGFPLGEATLALTVYLVASACGAVLGGILADRTEHHDRVAMTGVIAAGLLILTLAGVPAYPGALFPVMAVAGLAFGVTGPSRDVLIRRTAAGKRLGSVFGFVYSGFDLGSLISPLLFGALIDRNLPRGVFVAVAAAYLLAGPTVMQVGRRRATAAAATAAAAE